MKSLDIKKLYYSISDVSKIIDEEQYVLRYWETEFEQLRPQKNRAGNRIYGEKDLVVLHVIKHLLRGKRFTIDGAKEALRERSLHNIYTDIQQTSTHTLPAMNTAVLLEDSALPTHSIDVLPTALVPASGDHLLTLPIEELFPVERLSSQEVPHTESMPSDNAGEARHYQGHEYEARIQAGIQEYRSQESLQTQSNVEHLRTLHEVLTRLLHRLAVIAILISTSTFGLHALQERTADELYTALRKQFSSAGTMRIRFSIEQPSSPPPSAQNATLRGVMTIKKAKKFRLEMGNRTIVCNGTTLWNIANGTVVISDYVPDPRGMSPEMLFLDFPMQYKADLARELDSQRGSTLLLTLTPSSPQTMIGNIERILLRLRDTGSTPLVIRSIETKQQGASTMRLSIADMQINPALADALFDYVPAKDMKVIDMR